MSVENPLVIDSLWREFEEEQEGREVITYCDGCGEEIYEGEDVYIFDDVVLHQDSICCEKYISNTGHLAIAE
jgi:hypothetical protein